MQRGSTCTRVVFGLLMSGMLIGIVSCSANKTPVYPVRGKVLVKGKPAGGAVVLFHPKEETKDKERVVPRGSVGLDGVFQLTSYKLNDGAPAGSYLVTVTWREPRERSDDEGKLLVNIRYLDPKTSGLTADIHSGTNELPPFELDP